MRILIYFMMLLSLISLAEIFYARTNSRQLYIASVIASKKP